jgi:mono/diheme cytochrome c family protein
MIFSHLFVLHHRRHPMRLWTPDSGLRTLIVFVLASALLSAADNSRGQTVFTTYCAACHGPEGAGLVGPNLTDTVFQHGNTKADIVRVVMNGVGDKGMPAWGAILPPEDVDAVADFTISLIGKNLTSPFAPGQSSVTPFPKGSVAFPLLMRTFMPTLGIDSAVFAHHDHGQVIAKFGRKGEGQVEGEQKPIDGVPSAITVSFGDALSYCFDTTECRLFYTWSGPYLDMTKYWGVGAGGGRKSNYVPIVMGPVWWRASGADPMQVPGATSDKPKFTGYRKLKNVPELQWRIGDTQIALRITPGTNPGEAVCQYTTTGATKGLVFTLPADSAERMTCDKGTRDGTTLTLSPADAAQFTLTISPGAKPVIEAPKPPAKVDKNKDLPAEEEME